VRPIPGVTNILPVRGDASMDDKRQSALPMTSSSMSKKYDFSILGICDNPTRCDRTYCTKVAMSDTSDVEDMVGVSGLVRCIWLL